MSWIAIFKPGTHTDAAGNKITYSEDDVKNMVTAYNVQSEDDRHDAPLVKGHPATDDPALGWVDKLKYEGGKLWAKLKDVKDEVINDVKEGAYKKVSVRLYSDNKLRHVGLLGATPPAIKGLGDVKFSEFISTEFNNEMDFTFADTDKLKEAQPKRSEMIEIGLDTQNMYSNENNNNFSQNNKGDKMPDNKFLKFRDAFIEKLKEQTSDDIATRAAAIFTDEVSEKTFNAFSELAPEYLTVPEVKDDNENKGNSYEESEAYKRQQKEIQELREQNRKHDFKEYLETTNLIGVQKTKALPVLEIAYRKDNKVDIPFTYAEGDKSSIDIVKDFINTIPNQGLLNEDSNAQNYTEQDDLKKQDDFLEAFNKEIK
jgi:hypothetical protein